MSVIDWLGNVPTNWEIVPLRFLTSVSGGATPDTQNPAFWSGTIPWVSPKDMKRDYIDDAQDHVSEAALDNSALRMIDPKAVLIVVRGMILAHSFPVAINTAPVTINQDMKALNCHPIIEPEFLAFVLRGATDYLVTLADSSAHGTKKIETAVLGQLKIPVPPLNEQINIVRYIDREASRIDALIAAKQRLLDLMAEKRRAIIAESVMRGLDPNAPMRPSDIDWVGDIPAHWDIERSRWLFRERDKRSETGSEEMLTVSHITGVTPRTEKDVNMFEAESTVGYKLCFAGDLVINTLWAWMGAMGTARVDGIVSPAYNVYTPGSRLLPDYVDALVRIPAFAQEVTRYSKGVWSSRLRLYPEGFFETYWPVPPLSEQRAIVSRIADETAKIDRLRAIIEHSIMLLKERRGALIAAAVIGQTEIPEAV